MFRVSIPKRDLGKLLSGAKKQAPMHSWLFVSIPKRDFGTSSSVEAGTFNSYYRLYRESNNSDYT
ncbi:hypothetical protein RIVM261_003040 [Rivularia sp. IAM M-261]|nr:hypothetical protein CAL7716_055730 [Calothrix sp. PCC 7716]GJD15348.1 hypothetical protein RIVM261_003040 [Rivularia sp. IAM M-261]